MIKLNSKTVMVVGGSGFIGHRVVTDLQQRGFDVVSFDLIQSVAGYNMIKADILELSSLQRLLFEYEIGAVIHLVGLPAVDQCQKSPQSSFLLNALSVQNTLEAMRIADIPRIIFASSAAVYGSFSNRPPLGENTPSDPNTMYGYHKLVAERLIESYVMSYGIRASILRLFNVYGADPRLGKDVISTFIRTAAAGQPLLVKGPLKYRDFVNLNDVALAFALALSKQHTSPIINIGTGELTTLKDVAQTVCEIFPETKVVEEKTPDDGTGLIADISLARKELNFKPLNPKDGIREYIVDSRDQLLSEGDGP